MPGLFDLAPEVGARVRVRARVRTLTLRTLTLPLTLTLTLNLTRTRARTLTLTLTLTLNLDHHAVRRLPLALRLWLGQGTLTTLPLLYQGDTMASTTLSWPVLNFYYGDICLLSTTEYLVLLPFTY